MNKPAVKKVGTFFICKYNGRYVPCESYAKAMLGIASHSLWIMYSQSELKELFGD